MEKDGKRYVRRSSVAAASNREIKKIEQIFQLMSIFHGLSFLRWRHQSDDHNFMYFGSSRAYPHKSKQCRKQFSLSNIQLPGFIGAISVIWPRKFECKLSSFRPIIFISFSNQTKNSCEFRAEMLSARHAILLTQNILKSIFLAQRWIFPSLITMGGCTKIDRKSASLRTLSNMQRRIAITKLNHHETAEKFIIFCAVAITKCRFRSRQGLKQN